MFVWPLRLPLRLVSPLVLSFRLLLFFIAFFLFFCFFFLAFSVVLCSNVSVLGGLALRLGSLGVSRVAVAFVLRFGSRFPAGFVLCAWVACPCRACWRGVGRSPAGFRSLVAFAVRFRACCWCVLLVCSGFVAVVLRCCCRRVVPLPRFGCCVRFGLGFLVWGLRWGALRRRSVRGLGSGFCAPVASAWRSGVRAPVRLVPCGLSSSGGFGRPLFFSGCLVSQLSLFSASSLPPVWSWGGSRSLSPAVSALAASVALAVLWSGAGLAVGCCVGADAVALSAAASAGVASRLAVFSAFGPLGSGSPAGVCSLSAVGAVRSAVAAGASLRSWAGGGVAVPLAARLASRSRTVAAAASAGVVVFLSPASRGSVLLAQSVAARGLPVVAFPAGGGVLPPLAPRGRWVPLSAAPASLALFSSFPGFFWV